jgi:hypothetical protein
MADVPDLRWCSLCERTHRPIWPALGPLRECPSCRLMHPPGTTCADGWAPYQPVVVDLHPMLPGVGQAHMLSAADRAWGEEVGACQHDHSKGRGTRGKSEFTGLVSKPLRIAGCFGEIAVARLMGIEPQIRCEDGPDRGPDIVLADGTKIEVKNGRPMEAKSKLRMDAWYVVGRTHDNVFTVSHVRHARSIYADHAEPPAHWISRGREATRTQNWRIL